MELNPVLEKLPAHLMDLVVEQPFDDYTSQDHAVWRYVMRQNINFLPDVAHHSYMGGLKKTGISVDYIPRMYGMNRILEKIGWAAVAVDGFIPPSAFMEFQAYNVLVIAADIRPLSHIDYTPAPDIIHEAAGHAPIIADEEYAEYLRMFGEIGSKAFLSSHDYDMYEAIRFLSILKTDPNVEPKIVAEAEDHLNTLSKHPYTNSELNLIRNLHWWTVEYGLIGSLDHPRIYGAGLLSSIGESYSALRDSVKKIPYSKYASEVSFDITRPQPQLFVTPSFSYLIEVLEEFKKDMAMNIGGRLGVVRAISSSNYATFELDSGLEISSVFEHFEEVNGLPVFIYSTGETAISYKGKELLGFGKKRFYGGFALPLGRPMNSAKPLCLFNDDDLIKYGLFEGNRFSLHYTDELHIEGVFNYAYRKDDKILFIAVNSCKILYQNRLIMDGVIDNFILPIGETIVSAYSGVADPDTFEFKSVIPSSKTKKIMYTKHDHKRHELYANVRGIREGNIDKDELKKLVKDINLTDNQNWLLALEIYELIKNKNPFFIEANFIQKILKSYKEKDSKLAKLIDDGMALIPN
ncbi:MAG: aromatic amino acid hydroxylase [Bacteroidales bacterium]